LANLILMSHTATEYLVIERGAIGGEQVTYT
jgi:hypothetical protein